jgi:hypothetical protein
VSVEQCTWHVTEIIVPLFTCADLSSRSSYNRAQHRSGLRQLSLGVDPYCLSHEDLTVSPNIRHEVERRLLTILMMPCRHPLSYQLSSKHPPSAQSASISYPSALVEQDTEGSSKAFPVVLLPGTPYHLVVEIVLSGIVLNRSSTAAAFTQRD